MKFKLSGYYEPTPQNIRKIGDSLQWVSQAVAGINIVNDNQYLALGIMILGSVGKILSNFFVEEK